MLGLRAGRFLRRFTTSDWDGVHSGETGTPSNLLYDIEIRSRWKYNLLSVICESYQGQMKERIQHRWLMIYRIWSILCRLKHQATCHSDKLKDCLKTYNSKNEHNNNSQQTIDAIVDAIKMMQFDDNILTSKGLNPISGKFTSDL